MLDSAEAEIVPLNLQLYQNWNGVVLRAHFNDNAGTATMHLFGACIGETSVKYLGSVAWVAGTQTNAAGRYFAKTATVTKYSRMTYSVSSDESGTGISEVEFDGTIYDRLWVGFTAISAEDNVTVEVNGY
jgi:hypothetical protein